MPWDGLARFMGNALALLETCRTRRLDDYLSLQNYGMINLAKRGINDIINIFQGRTFCKFYTGNSSNRKKMTSVANMEDD